MNSSNIRDSVDTSNSVIYDIGTQGNPGKEIIIIINNLYLFYILLIVVANLLITLNENLNGDSESYPNESNSNSDISDISENIVDSAQISAFLNTDSIIDETRVNIEEKALEDDNSSNAHEILQFNTVYPVYQLTTAIMNCLVGVSVLFLGASFIMMVFVVIKKKSLNAVNYMNNSQYDLIPSNKCESNSNISIELYSDNTENTDKVLNEKLLDSQLYDSSYELMTSEIDELHDDRICIRDF